MNFIKKILIITSSSNYFQKKIVCWVFIYMARIAKTLRFSFGISLPLEPANPSSGNYRDNWWNINFTWFIHTTSRFFVQRHNGYRVLDGSRHERSVSYQQRRRNISSLLFYLSFYRLQRFRDLEH